MDFAKPDALILVGGGGHCRALIDVLELCRLPVAGVVHGPDCALEPVLGYAPLGRDADLPALRQSFARAVVSVGQMTSCALRQKLFAQLDALAFELPAVVSPLAHVSRHARVGRGTAVMHQALINTNAVVGENCIINSRALVEHDCVVGAHCHVAVGAVLCGGVHLGQGCFVGAGALIMQEVRVAAGAVIGMGSVVKSDLPSPPNSAKEMP